MTRHIFAVSLIALLGCTSSGPGTETGGTDTDADVTAPTVVSITPVDQSVDVALDALVVVEFSEALAEDSVTTSALTVTAGGSSVSGSVSLDGSTLVFTADTELAPPTEHAVSIDTGLTDLAGNALGTVPGSTFTTVYDPDDANVVYLSYEATNVIRRADLTGNDLTGEALLEEGWDLLGQFRLSPDGLRVAFTADADDGTGPWQQLYTVSLGGGDAVRVSLELDEGGEVTELRWSPDGTRLAYTADPDGSAGGAQTALFVVAADGSGGQQVSTPNVGVQDSWLDWSPDGTKVAWVDDADRHLWVVDASGGTSVDVSGMRAISGDEEGPRWSPDGSKLGFNNSRAALWAGSPTGGTPVRLTRDVTYGVTDWAWLSNTEVIWKGCDGCSYSALNRSSIASPDAVQILTNSARIVRFALSEDRSTVAYFRDSPLGIWVADPNATTPDATTDVQVSPSAQAFQATDLEAPAIAPDGSYVAYRARTTSTDPYQLHVVKRDGTGHVELTAFDSTSDQLGPFSYGFSPRGDAVIYGAYDDTVRQDLAVLTRSTLDGTTQETLNTLATSDPDLFQMRDAAGVTRRFQMGRW